MPENYPDENIQHTEHGESLKSTMHYCLRLGSAHKVLFCTVLTVAVGFLHCHSCWGKGAAVLWPNCDFQL